MTVHEHLTALLPTYCLQKSIMQRKLKDLTSSFWYSPRSRRASSSRLCVSDGFSTLPGASDIPLFAVANLPLVCSVREGHFGDPVIVID